MPLNEYTAQKRPCLPCFKCIKEHRKKALHEKAQTQQLMLKLENLGPYYNS